MASEHIAPASSAGVRVDVTDVSFHYGKRQVLEQVCLTAEPGQVVGLLGPNGSGKSTLLRVISGVLAPYTGSVQVGGREVCDCPRRELARDLAVVPQETRFGFPFSALEIVLMGRHPHLAGLAFEGADDISRAREALALCGASAMELRRIDELSSGERQRVVFARALAQQPRVFLLDEPASFLDIRHQVELYDIVRGLAHEQNRCVITVLHDINLAAEYCDRLYLIKQGRIAAAGATEDVLTYANLKAVFETEVYVDTNALTGKLLVTPLSGRIKRQLEQDPPGPA